MAACVSGCGVCTECGAAALHSVHTQYQDARYNDKKVHICWKYILIGVCVMSSEFMEKQMNSSNTNYTEF